MDFTEDTTKQGKRLGEDVTSHSTTKKAKESIFSIYTSKPNLKLLKEAYGLLSSREKHDFEFELVPTIDEYHHFLQCSPAMDSCTFTPQAQHMKFTLEKVQEMLQAMWSFSFELSQSLVTTRDDSYGFNWNTALMALGKRLKGMTSSQRINFVALGIYGMMIFPIYVKTIVPMVIALFEQLLHTLVFNPASTVIVEILWSMKEFGLKDLATSHVASSLATINDVGFVLLTWNATHYLAPPEGHHSIPLLGIHGGVTYLVELASHQFAKAQSVPYLGETLQSNFDYMSSPAIVDKASEAHEMWEKCRMLPIWKEKGTRPQYEQWRLRWRAKLSLPWELLEKYDELALDHELLKKGKELSDQQVAGLKDKIASLEKDLVASKEICGKQKRSLEFAKEQRKKLLRVKADLKAREKENKELVEKVIKQQELKGKVIKWRNAYNNLLSDYDALQKELRTAKQSKQGEKEDTT
ncbi:hypothetical protein SLEP1_g26301 [Rubroshorea leprosula]|uniref:Uncharacterized protein n=1 Tax=Rubroshorea leprosula TaxID=152421 RepID=A0AAV5JLQ7_9ROSI|nr:hypothetical protein SLEP1_g26301 [Rubroshorea leprosula]